MNKGKFMKYRLGLYYVMSAPTLEGPILYCKYFFWYPLQSLKYLVFFRIHVKFVTDSVAEAILT